MADLSALRRQLGVPDAPMVNEGIACTVTFFKDVIADDPVLWIGYLRGIDFHHPVTVATLEPRKKLIRYESARRGPISRLPPFGYFTEAGVSPFHTGTSWPSWHYKEFTVVNETRALLSTGVQHQLQSIRRWRVTRHAGEVRPRVACGWRPAVHHQPHRLAETVARERRASRQLTLCALRGTENGQVSTRSASAQRSSIFSVRMSSALVRPRLIAAIGLPASAAAVTKR